jgi:hypothetical protein
MPFPELEAIAINDIVRGWFGRHRRIISHYDSCTEKPDVERLITELSSSFSFLFRLPLSCHINQESSLFELIVEYYSERKSYEFFDYYLVPEIIHNFSSRVYSYFYEALCESTLESIRRSVSDLMEEYVNFGEIDSYSVNISEDLSCLSVRYHNRYEFNHNISLVGLSPISSFGVFAGSLLEQEYLNRTDFD